MPQSTRWAADDQELSQLKSQLLTLQRERERSMEASSHNVDPSREIAPPFECRRHRSLRGGARQRPPGDRPAEHGPKRFSCSKSDRQSEGREDRHVGARERSADRENQGPEDCFHKLQYSKQDRQQQRHLSNFTARVLSMSFKTPRTPGTPLREASLGVTFRRECNELIYILDVMAKQPDW